MEFFDFDAASEGCTDQFFGCSSCSRAINKHPISTNHSYKIDSLEQKHMFSKHEVNSGGTIDPAVLLKTDLNYSCLSAQHNELQTFIKEVDINELDDKFFEQINNFGIDFDANSSDAYFVQNKYDKYQVYEKALSKTTSIVEIQKDKRSNYCNEETAMSFHNSPLKCIKHYTPPTNSQNFEYLNEETEKIDFSFDYDKNLQEIIATAFSEQNDEADIEILVSARESSPETLHSPKTTIITGGKTKPPQTPSTPASPKISSKPGSQSKPVYTPFSPISSPTLTVKEKYSKGKIKKPKCSKISKPKVKKTKKQLKAKRPKLLFPKTALFYQRIKNYWNVISNNIQYNNKIKNAISKHVNNSLTVLSPEKFIGSVIPPLLPNNATIDFFQDKQNKDGWIYYTNKNRKNQRLSLRWCGQLLNFYDPFIYRHRLDKNGNVSSKQAMCPYCPLDKKTDLNNIFHTTVDSLYMHHLCKGHGVYSTGYEMAPPLFVNCEGTNMIICSTCGENCNVIRTGDDSENCLISYFRHVFGEHNNKKQNKPKAEKALDLIKLKYKPNALFEKIEHTFEYKNFVETRHLEEHNTITELSKCMEHINKDQFTMEQLDLIDNMLQRELDSLLKPLKYK